MLKSSQDISSADNRRILEAELDTLELDENVRQQLLKADDTVVGIIVQSKNMVTCFAAFHQSGLIKVPADQAKYKFVAEYYKSKARKAAKSRGAKRDDIGNVLGSN